MKHRRKILFVDSDVQGAILLRIIGYWLACLMFVTLPILLTMTSLEPDMMFFHHVGPMLQRYWPIYLTLGLLLPFVMRDALRMSNRFCGPMKRMFDEIERVNSGEEFRRVEFRDDDFWKPLADALNEFAENRSSKAPVNADPGSENA